MSKHRQNHGANNFLGLNYQAWAALSLFLQHLRYHDFESIHLEAPELQDFDLKFSDGRKIICEAKGWKSAFGAPNLKKVFNAIKKRGVTLQSKENLLIICNIATLDLKRLLKRVKNLSPGFYKQAVEGTIFKSEDIPTLQKVLIWEVKQEDTAKIALALFSELIDGWVDYDVLKQLVQNLLVEKIYHGSAHRKEWLSKDFREAIQKESEKLRSSVGACEQPQIERLGEIYKAVENPKHKLWAPANLSAVSGHIGEVLFATELLKNQTNLNLQDWSRVINALVDLRVGYRAFDLIKKNLNSKENLKFANEFLSLLATKNKKFFSFDFRERELMQLAVEIFDIDSDYGLEILSSLKSIVRNLGGTKFFVRTKDNLEYLREEIGKVAYRIYDGGDDKLRDAVVEFSLESFNLVEDEGDYWHKAPPGIFESVKDSICSDVKKFEKRFLTVCDHLSKQYSETFKAKYQIPFRGYELIGGIGSGWGGEITIKDRFFIQKILTPSLTYYWEKSPKEAFQFIKKYCVFGDEKISKKKPDFLRRACIPILLNAYNTNSLNKRIEVYKILIKFIKFRKGIPSKYHLIYQLIHKIDSTNLQWELVLEAVKLSPIRINSFVIKAVCNLVEQQDQEALNVAKDWLSKPDKLADSLFGGGPLKLLKSIATVEPNLAFEAFLNLVKSDFFRLKVNDFDVYEWCDFLVGFLNSHFVKVKNTLHILAAEKTLSQTQQILLISTLAKIGADEKVSEEAKVDIYNNVVRSIIKDRKFVTKIPISHIREQLTEYADGLIKNQKSEDAISCAIEILEALVNDPSPEILSVTNKEQKSSESGAFTIESVRGKVAWSLQSFFNAAARKFFPRLRLILDTLLNDRHPYIRSMACYPFSILLGNRYTFTSKDLSIPLLADDKFLALIEAHNLEIQALDFISRNINVSAVITRNLPNLFNMLRLVNFESAKRILHLAEEGGVELTKEILPIIIFFAHFRERVVNGPVVEANPFLKNLADQVFEYDFFKTILQNYTLHENEDLRGSLSWHFMKISDAKEEPDAIANISISLSYFKLFARRYDKDVFSSIYMFIEEHIEYCFDECMELWLKLLPIERDALKKALDSGANLYDVQWWPFSFNNEIILTSFNKGRIDCFLKGIEMLLSYPIGVTTGLDKKVADALVQVQTDESLVRSIFHKWIERDSARFLDMKAWEKSL